MKLIHSTWNRDPERLALNEANDCTVQALASGLHMSYSKAHALLKEGGRKDRDGFPFGPFLERMNVPGFRIEKVDHDELKWQDNDPDVITRYEDRRYWRRSYGYREKSIEKYVSVSKFAATHPKGTYFLMSSGHAQVMIDGTLIDSRPSPRAKVTHAYRLVEAKPDFSIRQEVLHLHR